MVEKNIFNLAAERTQWLSARQAAIAGNVANANTPGFLARDVVPFAAHLDSQDVDLMRTNTAHFSTTSDNDVASTKLRAEANPWDTSPSGNSVSVEQELTKATGVSRDVAALTQNLLGRVNARLHAKVLSDVMLQEFAYVAKTDIQKDG
jgi:flagellar basal-body rod protein FlgB